MIFDFNVRLWGVVKSVYFVERGSFMLFFILFGENVGLELLDFLVLLKEVRNLDFYMEFFSFFKFLINF